MDVAPLLGGGALPRIPVAWPTGMANALLFEGGTLPGKPIDWPIGMDNVPLLDGRAWPGMPTILLWYTLGGCVEWVEDGTLP